MKKIVSLLCIFVLAVSVLCACGGKKEPETQPQTTEAAPQTEKPTEKQTEAEAKEPMDSGDLVDRVFKDLNLSLAFADDIMVHAMDADGNVTISFKLNNIDCSYVLNGTTGEIVSKNVPTEALEEPANSMDPFERAINMAMDSLEGYSGGAENITVSMNEGIIDVDFDWNGKHHSFHYDMNQDKLID